MQQPAVDLLIKVIPAAVGVIGLFPVMYNLLVGRKGQLREEYKFAKEFLNDLETAPDFHPFAKEKGLQALANDRYIEADQVEFLLAMKKPARGLRDFILGRGYLELVRNEGTRHIQFKSKYQKTWARSWRKWGYVSLYVLFAIAAYSPILLQVWIPMSPDQLAVNVLGTGAIFGSCAWLALREAARIYRAEVLVSGQEKTAIVIQSDETDLTIDDGER